MLRSLQRQFARPSSSASPSRAFSSSTINKRNEGTQWEPKKRVSRPTMDKMRALNASQPEVYNIVTLSKEFKLSVEGVRRILKSKYIPNSKEEADRQEKNRYEAMGERRKEFKTKHPEAYQKTDAWKREEKIQDISTPKKKDTWANDTYGNWKNVSDNTKWGETRDEKRIWNRDEEGSRSFNRSGDRSSYNRSEGNDRRSFNRSSEDNNRRFYNRFEDSNGRSHNFSENGVRRSYNRSEEGDRRSFNRSEDGDRRSYNRFENEDRRSFNRSRDGERRSFNNREENGNNRQFSNNTYKRREEDSGERRRFNRDEPRKEYNRRPFNNRDDRKPFDDRREKPSNNKEE